MKAIAIVAEYNPFHNGHLYQLTQAKQQTQADVVIALMSGNWMQRGEPAIFDKWQRARAALNHGIDLVVELPFATAVQPANLFAMGAVRLASELNASYLSFGAENPTMDYQTLIDHQPDATVFRRFDQTYATLYQQFLNESTGIKLNQPNDILAYSYANANHQLGNPIQLVPIQRLGSQHNDQDLNINRQISSATAIRKTIIKQQLQLLDLTVPKATLELIKDNQPLNWTQFWPLLRYELVETPINELHQIYQMTEGIEYRLKKAAEKATSFDEFVHLVKTKRYTYARIRRLCIYVLMHAYDTEVKKATDYARILGFTATGQRYLNQLKKEIAIPMITKMTDDLSRGMMALDYRAGMLIQLINNQPQDFYQRPIMIK